MHHFYLFDPFLHIFRENWMDMDVDFDLKSYAYAKHVQRKTKHLVDLLLEQETNFMIILKY